MLKNQEKLEEQMRDRYSVEKLFDNTSETASENDKDTEKEDFTKPRVVQRYSQYTQDNTDIQDYTDHVEVSNNQEESKELISENKLEVAKNIFQKIFAKIQSIFKKA